MQAGSETRAVDTGVQFIGMMIVEAKNCNRRLSACRPGPLNAYLNGQ